jgi:hypothetical protein
MTLTVVTDAGVTIVEGAPEQHFMSSVTDTNRLMEACFSAGTRFLLLYAENLTPSFFDLSSGDAGDILQKLRNYGIRLAVVRDPARVRASSRFGEMAAEEDRGPHFRLFESREAARAWLNRGTIHPQDGHS